MSDLSVLSPRRDPYRLDTPALHRDGRWLADQIARLAVKLPIHLRGLHYAIVAAAVAVRFNGLPYTNTEENWIWLSEVAAKAARWLGYLPFDSIVDERNEAPAIFIPEAVEPRPRVYCSFDFRLPDPDDLEPIAALDGLRPRQPYRIVLAGEKTSLRAILEPVARRFGAELVLPTGEMSDTLIKGIADRAAEDGRPCVVLYFADFDPAGWQMPVSVARKLQALGDLMPGLPLIEVHRVALLPQDVERLGLPSTPLKATEKRADGWRARWGGLEQTEIDALAALRPDELRRITEDAVAPFFDPTLEARSFDARRAWQQRADECLCAVVDQDWLEQARLELQAKLAEIEPELRRLQSALELDVSALDLPPVPEVGPDVDGLPSAPPPLWSSEEDWTEATRRLAADIAHADGEARP
jgi:hypothetical protein